jgi:hypothetical protein
MLPQANAHIVKIERSEGTTAGGFHEDYDQPATDPESAGGMGKDEWTGRRPAYWIETRRRITQSESSRQILERSLLVDRKLPDFIFRDGDVVTVEHGGQQKTGKVALVEVRESP